MTYKSGEVPQVGDSVMGDVKGTAARGKVIGVRDGGGILLERRAAYEGKSKPLAVQHDECKSEDFDLVYRKPSTSVPSEPAPKAKPEKKASKK